MAEALAIAASVIAVIQISEKIIKLCKHYVGSVQSAPLGLRLILNETSALKSTFESLHLLLSGKQVPKAIVDLANKNGPVHQCRKAAEELEKLLPNDTFPVLGYSQQKSLRKGKSKPPLVFWTWVFNESKAKALLEEIRTYKATIALRLSVESIQELVESHRTRILEWLRLTDPSPLHNKSYALYEPGTGSWILRSTFLQEWIDGKQRSLWIHGIPGAGKTVLVSHLIQQLKQPCTSAPDMKQAYVYYYCSFEHKQDESAPLLRWMLNQLCRQGELITLQVQEMYKQGLEPNMNGLLDGLAEVVDCFDVVYLFVDALDESLSRENLLGIVRSLLAETRFQKLQIIAASREYTDIERMMADVTVSIPMDNDAVKHDIRRYVRAKIDSNRRFKHWSPELLTEVEDAISSGARGMFRWAVCQILVLERLKAEPPIVRNALRNLPRTLDETYDRILLEIPEEERLFVYHALHWISFYTDLHGDSMPFSALLEGAKSTTVEADPSRSDRHYDVDILREFCGCLIHTADGITVSFAHYTVREYLDSKRFSAKLSTFFPGAGSCHTSGYTLKRKFIATVLEQAQRPANGQGCLDREFTNFCMRSALVSLRCFAMDIVQEVKLQNLAISLLDPKGSHFMTLRDLAWADHDHFTRRGLANSVNLGNIIWLGPPRSTEVEHLFYLLLTYSDMDSAPGHGLELARRYLSGRDSLLFLKSVLTLTLREFVTHEQTHERPHGHISRGTIFELFALWASTGSGALSTLLEYGTGLYDPDRVLFCFLYWHSKNCRDHKTACLLDQFLEAGADALGTSHQITPLEMAVAIRDQDAEEVLLKAAAIEEIPWYMRNTSELDLNTRKVAEMSYCYELPVRRHTGRSKTARLRSEQT